MNITIQSLIDQVMPLALATGLFVSTCSIQQPSGEQNDDGTPKVDPTTHEPLYVPVVGLQDITCMAAPEGGIKANEVKSESEIISYQYRHVLLGGFYPQIPDSDDNWQAVIKTFTPDGVFVESVVWDLVGAESDSQSQMTRLQLRIAEL